MCQYLPNHWVDGLNSFRYEFLDPKYIWNQPNMIFSNPKTPLPSSAPLRTTTHCSGMMKHTSRAAHRAIYQRLYGAVWRPQHPYRQGSVLSADGTVGGTVWCHMILYLYGHTRHVRLYLSHAYQCWSFCWSSISIIIVDITATSSLPILACTFYYLAPMWSRTLNSHASCELLTVLQAEVIWGSWLHTNLCLS